MADKTAAKPNKTGQKQKTGFLKRITRYFRDLRSEFKKIVWPTRKQIINNTIVVLVVVILVGAFVAGLDTLLSLLVRFVLQQA